MESIADGIEDNEVIDSYPPYTDCDKQTLIEILSSKDRLISQKMKDITGLQVELTTIKEENVCLREELEKLRSELHGYEEEHGQKPMPDWNIASCNDSALSISDVIRATAEAELKNMEPDVENCVADTEGQKGVKEKETNPEYVYDSASGYYYHPSTGYYWDPNSGLFYDYTSGFYYRYNETSGEYEVHSQVSNETQSISTEGIKKTKCLITAINKSSYIKTCAALKLKGSSRKKRKNKKSGKIEKQFSKTISKQSNNNEQGKEADKTVDSGEGKEMKSSKNQELPDSDNESSGSLATDESELLSDPESGEIISSSSSDVEIIEEEMPSEFERETGCTGDYSSEQQLYEEAMVENYPPCIRVIVQESERLCIGTLFIVTCAGGTIGRDTVKKHIITIPDIGVSKNHASIEYDFEESCYKLTDLGSQNGTRVNCNTLCQTKLENDKQSLTHGDVIQLGNCTKLLLHIHKGHETCEECEPGQIQAKLKAINPVKNTHIVMSKEERKQQQKKELKKIKKKYGLQNSYFENEGAIVNDPNYADKAYLRRKFIGSDNENTKPESRPASVHCPIGSLNKGHALLAKMGWKEGEGLGRTNTGITEPINVELRVNQHSGLGSETGHSLSLDNVHNSSKAKRWSQARQRFNQLQPTTTSDSSSAKKDPPSVVNPTDDNIISQNASSSDKNVPTLLPSASKSILKTSGFKPHKNWHKGATETLSTSQSDDNKIS